MNDKEIAKVNLIKKFEALAVKKTHGLDFTDIKPLELYNETQTLNEFSEKLNRFGVIFVQFEAFTI